jgi:demethylmenaquinone methyltransferase/2-methoxy-6-polyprenyl-1,4-benzoquinol methylase
MRSIYLFYFRYLLPFIGSVISGDGSAYRYLNETVEGFPYGDAFCQLLRESGFQNVSMYPQTFGIATIYCGDKD